MPFFQGLFRQLQVLLLVQLVLALVIRPASITKDLELIVRMVDLL